MLFDDFQASALEIVDHDLSGTLFLHTLEVTSISASFDFLIQFSAQNNQLIPGFCRNKCCWKVNKNCN